MNPVVTVVVSTFNRARLVPRLLAALEAQELDEPFDVILVDNGSTDDTWDVLQRLRRETTLDLSTVRVEVNRGPAGARNLGWRRSTSSALAFTDDDCVPQPGWLRELLTALDGAELAQGRTLPNPEHGHRHGPFSRTLIETSEGLYPTCNVAYRREALERVGGFDESMRWCEDTDLAMRVLESGGASGWAPEAVVYHDVHPSDVRAYFREKWHWEAIPQLLKRHPQLRAKLYSHWFWRPAHPPALAAVTGLSLVLARRSPTALAIAAALAVPYVQYRTRRAPLQAGPRRRLALIPVALAGDVLEIGVVLTASVRYRTLVL